MPPSCAVTPFEFFFLNQIYNVEYSAQLNLPHLSPLASNDTHSFYVIPFLLPAKSINRICAASPFMSLLLIAVTSYFLSRFGSILDDLESARANQPLYVITVRDIPS